MEGEVGLRVLIRETCLYPSVMNYRDQITTQMYKAYNHHQYHKIRYQDQGIPCKDINSFHKQIQRRSLFK